tara:strand:- start:1982 stop:2227 length:246 start_codon:yes stop_codon:yes gene_type:complete
MGSDTGRIATAKHIVSEQSFGDNEKIFEINVCSKCFYVHYCTVNHVFDGGKEVSEGIDYKCNIINFDSEAYNKTYGITYVD